MKSEKETSSVIARLMGFDELPTQRMIHNQRKVLSEGYFRKVASIGQCENSKFYSRYSSRIISNQKISKDKDETKENFGFDNLHKLITYRRGMKQKTRISRNNFFFTGDKKKSDVFRDKIVKENKEITQKEPSRRVLSRQKFKEDEIRSSNFLKILEDDKSFENLSNHFQLEGFDFSNSNKVVPEFAKDLRVNNQSPNSVLNLSFQEESIYSDDFHRNEMSISSDEELSEKECVSFLQYTFDVKESRNFSYLIDVLDEVGFTSTNQEISILVFLKLEKKYGKQMYWKRSERRLLFDQIKIGLKEIKEKPLSFGLRRDEIEEELWTVVIRDEKKAKQKCFGTEIKWLNFKEEVYDICKEIEDYLFDVLIGELVGAEGV